MIFITGGGTGGHLAIANAMKEELNNKGIKPIYIGSQNGQDRVWFENDDGFEETYFLNSSGVVNKKGLKKFAVLKDILGSSFTCKDIFKQHTASALFCVGGYSAAPASIAAIMNRIPLYIHEQNAILGKLNKILKPFCKEFFSSYDEHSKVKEYPVSDVFFKKRRIREELKTIIFLGGSQGARFINDLAMSVAPYLLDKGIKVIHQTGKTDYTKVKDFYEKNSLHVDCFDFTNNIVEKISSADFAVSRAGASTLWELSANALPALFIPYPYAAKNHQYFNAKVLSDKKIAFLSMQDDLSEDIFINMLNSLNLYKMSKNLSTIISTNGIKKIANIIIKG